MSDLRIRGFDADTIGAAVRQPSLESLRSAASRRRFRRRGGALATLLLLAVPVALFGPLPASSPRPPDAISTPPVDVLLLGPRTAVAVWRPGECEIGFRGTDDGGRTWSPYRTSKGVGPCPAPRWPGEERPVSHSYLALGPTTYVIGVDDGKPRSSNVPVSFVSTDGGSTWRDTWTASTEVDAFPAGAEPVGCAVCAATGQPLAFDPATGGLYRLRTGPWANFAMFNFVVTHDGSMWMSVPGLRDTVRYRVYRSTDRGRTLTATANPAKTTDGATIVEFRIAARDAREAYALGSVASADIRTALLRTVDGGQTWTEITTDLAVSSRTPLFTVLPDGTLVVLEPIGSLTRAWVSRDGGARFTAGPTVARTSGSGLTADRVWLRDDATNRVLVTEDGVTWTPMALPPVR